MTRTIDGSAKMTWIPCAAKNASNQPPRPKSRIAMRPTMTGETASGRSTSAEIRRFPGKWSRVSTSATMMPNTVFTMTVISMIRNVR